MVKYVCYKDGIVTDIAKNYNEAKKGDFVKVGDAVEVDKGWRYSGGISVGRNGGFKATFIAPEGAKKTSSSIKA